MDPRLQKYVHMSASRSIRLPGKLFSSARSLLLGGLVASVLGGCAPMAGDEGSNSSELSRTPEYVNVKGRRYNVETEYLPRVVQCENPGAPLESLRAQAIAARTYLTYRTRGQATPSIADGQSEQVFTCPSNKNGTSVPDAVVQAVADTHNQVLMYKERVIAGFFVAGASRNSACKATSDPTNTERFITINVGLSGTKVKGSSIGNRTDNANRGAMGQNLANCLANRDGLVAAQLLQYFYGADIAIRGDDNLPTVPTPAENDPALAPAIPDPTQPVTPDPGNPATPEPDPTPVPDPTMATPATCWSYTLQSWVGNGECVQSVTDRAWYQCADQAGFVGPVNASTGVGPSGPCTAVHPL